MTELPHDEDWGDIDVAKVKQWDCIAATIEYTMWLDVDRCEGFVTIDEPTGKMSTRGKNAGRTCVTEEASLSSRVGSRDRAVECGC